MQKMKKWFGRRIGSTESLNRIATPGIQTHPILSKTDYELLSIKIKHLLERKQFQKVIDTLREQPSAFILKCLGSFPFKVLNKAVPDAFPVWETLLTKLHNSEEGHIREFPYKSCDELVLKIAWLIEMRDAKSQAGQELVVSCRRVLKCVYMQYDNVLENVYKEHSRVQHSLYTLGLHLPLGSDSRTALSLHHAIKKEINGCLMDLSDAKERLEVMSDKEELTLTEALEDDRKGVELATGSDEDSGDDGGLTMKYQDFPQPPNPNQVQLHERLYQNQCVRTSLRPSRGTDTLPQLIEILNERILGDKEVLAVFGRIRLSNDGITDSEPIDPWLRRYQRSIECIIGIIRDIEKDLEIKVIKAESPSQFQTRYNGIVDEDPQIVSARPRSRSYEHSPLPPRRHSATIVESDSQWRGECEDIPSGLSERTDKNRLSVTLSTHRPRSTSPSKRHRVNGGPPVRSPSSKSMSSSNGSNSDITGVQASSSIGDLHSTNRDTPLAFTRVQSLKTNHSVQVFAGKRKLSVGKSRNSWISLVGSKSAGNVSSIKKPKSLFSSSESGGIAPWERQSSGDGQQVGHYMLLQQELEVKTKDLQFTRDQLYELKRRERELTDRLSEQAQRHLHDSEKFEDIQLGLNRPSMVVMRYQELFSQGRVEAIEALQSLEDSVEEGNKLLATQFVLDALEFSHVVSCQHLNRMQQDWRSLLGIEEGCEDTIAVRQLESAIGLYLRRACSLKDVTDITKSVEELLEEKYASHPVFYKAWELDTVRSYISECSKVCWDLCVQTPTMHINSKETLYNDDKHQRFFNSDKESCDIVEYLWPTLLQESPTGGSELLLKGWVQT